METDSRIIQSLLLTEKEICLFMNSDSWIFTKACLREGLELCFLASIPLLSWTMEPRRLKTMFSQTMLHFGFASRSHPNKAKVGRRYIALVGAPGAAVAQGGGLSPQRQQEQGLWGFWWGHFPPFGPLALITLLSTIPWVKSSAA